MRGARAIVMKSLLLVAALAHLTLRAAHADTVFVGNTFISAVSGTSSCTSTFQVNDTARALYRPRGSALGNGGDSYLAYVTNRSSMVMAVLNNDFRADINYSGSGVSSRAGLISKAGGITVWQQTPANIAPGTPSVAIKGRFANFFGIKDCFVEFKGNLIVR
jgi:hypothetical protein